MADFTAKYIIRRISTNETRILAQLTSRISETMSRDIFEKLQLVAASCCSFDGSLMKFNERRDQVACKFTEEIKREIFQSLGVDYATSKYIYGAPRPL